MAWAATIRVKLAELTLVERILRKIAPMKPHAQLCHEFAFVLHRPRREALAAETCRKCLDVDCQRAYAGRLGPRRRAIIGIGHHSSPLSRGKSPVREDGRIMPSRQRSTPQEGQKPWRSRALAERCLLGARSGVSGKSRDQRPRRLQREDIGVAYAIMAVW